MVHMLSQLNLLSSTRSAGLRSDTDKWLTSYEDATTLANDALGSIQVHYVSLMPAGMCFNVSDQLAFVATGAEPQVRKWWP